MDLYRVFYTKKALSDLAEIAGCIAEDDEAAAARFGTALLDDIELPTRFPRMGTSVEGRSKTRRLVHGPIIVYYTLRKKKRLIEVLHFRHGAWRSLEA